MICSLNYQFSLDYKCKASPLFGDRDSAGLVYITSQNFNPSLTLLFYEFNQTSKMFLVFKLNVQSIVSEKINFKVHNFYFNNEIDFGHLTEIRSFGFPSDDNEQTKTILVVYSHPQVVILHLSRFSVYEPIFRTIADQRIFVNQEYIMIVDYASTSIEYISIQNGYFLTRPIWPPLRISPLFEEKFVGIIHDFFIANLYDDHSVKVTVKVADANPYVSRQASMDANQKILKYLKTDTFSMVVFDFQDDVFHAFLSSNLLKYQLSSSRSNAIQENQHNATTLFSFFTIFYTINRHVFLNQINVDIPNDYFINSPSQIPEIRLTSDTECLDFSDHFSGNIYSIDFKSESPEGAESRNLWTIENSSRHGFQLTIPGQPITMDYMPYLYITPVNLINISDLHSGFVWGVQTHTSEYLMALDTLSGKLAFFKQISEKKIALLALVVVTNVLSSPIDDISMEGGFLFVLSGGSIYVFDISSLYLLIEFRQIVLGPPISNISFLSSKVLLTRSFFVSGERTRNRRKQPVPFDRSVLRKRVRVCLRGQEQLHFPDDVLRGI